MVQNISSEGLYIYCITKAREELELGPIGVGNRDDSVFVVNYRDIAAVVSESIIMNYPVSRDNTLAHQIVMEKTMEGGVILPVRFGTVAEGPGVTRSGERIREEVLKARYSELWSLLHKMEEKVELGVKVLWSNMQQIFAELASENAKIRKLRDEIKRNPSGGNYKAQIVLGKMVKASLDAKKAAEKEKVLSVLKKLSVDIRDNNTFGDQMFLNGAFLVETRREKEFDKAVEEIINKQSERLKVRYIGPIPPCNFIEIEINWKKEGQGG